MKDVKVRGVLPSDAEPFAKWAVENSQIDDSELTDAIRNPTTQTIVIEVDGKVVMYVPFYCLLKMAYLGFNPDAGPKERVIAMEAVVKTLTEFAKEYHLAEIQTLSKREYPVAKWAMKHGFKMDARNPLRLEI